MSKGLGVGQFGGVLGELVGELLAVEAVILEAAEFGDGAMEGAFVGGAVALEAVGEFHEFGVSGEDEVCAGLLAEGGFLEGDVAEFPGGEDEFVEDEEFGIALGGEFGEEARAELVEFGLVQFGEEEALGGEAVGASVLGRTGFAFGGNGALGPGSVAASGVAVCLADG